MSVRAAKLAASLRDCPLRERRLPDQVLGAGRERQGGDAAGDVDAVSPSTEIGCSDPAFWLPPASTLAPAPTPKEASAPRPAYLPARKPAGGPLSAASTPHTRRPS